MPHVSRSLVMRHRDIIFSKSVRMCNSSSPLQRTTLSKKTLINITMAGGHTLSTAFLTGFEVILSRIVLSAAQVSHLLGWLVEDSVANQGNCRQCRVRVVATGQLQTVRVVAAGQLQTFASLLFLLSSVLALVFDFFLIRLMTSTCFLKIIRIRGESDIARTSATCDRASPPGRHRKHKRCLPPCA